MNAIESSHGNYNLKDTYKKKFQKATYVDTRMNGLALLKTSNKVNKNKSQPTLKQCSSAFLETYLLAERQKRLSKHNGNVENSFQTNTNSMRQTKTQQVKRPDNSSYALPRANNNQRSNTRLTDNRYY